MQAVISGVGLKIFTKALRHLARFSTDLYIEATKESLVLRSVNQGKTCFLSISFSSIFFVSYEPAADDDFEGNNCCVSIRQLLMALRNIKNVINCKINLNSSKEILEINLIRPQDYTFQNHIRVLEYENLEEFDPPTEGISTLICRPSSLNDILNIPKNLHELELDFKNSKLEIRNHISHPDQDVQTVRLKYHVEPVEFTQYEIKQEVCLIVLHQALESILEFAENGDEIKIEFTVNGEPLIISIANDDQFVKVQLVTSTMEENFLKTLNKPQGATSYKHLIESYIEKRQSGGETDLPRPINLSESEMAKNLSPRISTFGPRSNLLNENKTKKEIPIQKTAGTSGYKRKSIDVAAKNVESVDLTNEPEDEPSKRPRIDDDISENIAASRFLADLDEMDAQSNGNDIIDEINRTNHKIAKKSNNSMNEVESDQVSVNRMDISKANLPSEDFQAPLESSQEARRRQFSLANSKALLEKTVNEVQKRLEEGKKKAENLYQAIKPIRHQRHRFYDGGAILVPESDSEGEEK